MEFVQFRNSQQSAASTTAFGQRRPPTKNRSPDTRSRFGWFPKFNGNFFVNNTSMLTFSWISDQFFQRYGQNCWKNALSRNVEEFFKKSYIRLRDRWLPKFNQFFLSTSIHQRGVAIYRISEYTSGTTFMDPISSFTWSCSQTNKQIQGET